METYRTHINRATRNGQENLVIVDMERDRFERKDLKTIIGMMFELAAEGIGNKALTATVHRGDEKIFTVRGLTKVDGSTIFVGMDIARPREKFHRIRCMTIAS